MTLVLDLAIRSAILVLLGLAGVAVLRRQPAALRHAMLAMTIIATAALLPLKAIVPAWQVPLPIFVAPQVAVPQPWGASLPVPDVSQMTARPASTTTGPPGIVGSVAAGRPGVNLVQFARIIWFVGFAVCAGSLLTGLVRLSRIARRAERVRGGEWMHAANRLQEAYGLRRPVTFLQTDAPDVIATFGMRRHRVLLPVHARAWSPDRIHAVLSHELAHVRRHDWLVQMGAEALRCVYWFNPLMWIACARLRCESEYACDDVVLGRGMAPRDYAVHLLELARVCRHPRRYAVVSALPMARASTLERRITVMLNPAVNRTSVSRRARVAAAALLACLSVSVAAVRAGQSAPLAPSNTHTSSAVTGASLTLPDAKPVAVAVTANASSRVASSAVARPTRVIEAARPVLHTEPGVVAVRSGHGAQNAALAGSIYDSSGGVMPGVAVTLRDAQQSALTATTNANGRFQFPSVAPGAYVLEAALRGFRTLRQNIELRTAGDWDRAITLQLGQLTEKVVVSASRVTAPATVSPAQPARIRVGGNVRPPSKLVDAKPVYPESMREAGREAVVSLEAVIGTDGLVTSVRVVSADIHPDFAIAAAEAVRQWTFEPTRLNGMAVEVQMTVSVEFTLSK
jgi:TonB family protein